MSINISSPYLSYVEHATSVKRSATSCKAGSVLIATGVLAAKHHLDITPVLLWATVGANAGGITPR